MSPEEKAEAVPKEEAASEEEEEPTMLELEALEAIEEQMIEHMEGDFEEGDLDDQGKPGNGWLLTSESRDKG